MGTRDNDRITGRGGDDRTVGKAGNDTYFYANGWGQDTVVDSGGTDTLNFSAVTEGVQVNLCSPVGGGPDGLVSSGDNMVFFGSRIEGARGGLGTDMLLGCGGENTLTGGGNPSPTGNLSEMDMLLDADGLSISGTDNPDFAASDDVYLGSREGWAIVADSGGAADVLNLSGIDSRNANLAAVDLDYDEAEGSLWLTFGPADSPTGSMVLANQSEDDEFSTLLGAPFVFDGRIEQIKFKNETIDMTNLPPVPEASARESAAIAEQLSDDLNTGDLLP